MAQLIIKGRTSYLCYNGYIYIKYSSSAASKYWRCKSHRECSARLTSTLDDGGNIVVKKGSDVESHNHAPNPEEVQALILLTSMMRQASEHLEVSPSRIMRRLQDAPTAVLAQLPERENIQKQIQRERLKDLPSNPTSIKDLEEIPDRYRITKNGENFLLYDSYDDDNYTLDGRIIILRRMPSSHYQAVDRRIFNIVANYEVYKEDGTVLEYLKNLSNHLHVYT